MEGEAPKGWNWGAFFLSWIWGIANKTYIAFLVFIPLLNVIMIFVLGAKGNEWAWKNREWESEEQFRKVQKAWGLWGFILFLVFIVLWVVSIVVGIASIQYY